MTRSAASALRALAGRTRGVSASTRAVLLAAARWYLFHGAPTPRQTAQERELGLAVAAWMGALQRGAQAVRRPAGRRAPPTP